MVWFGAYHSPLSVLARFPRVLSVVDGYMMDAAVSINTMQPVTYGQTDTRSYSIYRPLHIRYNVCVVP